MNRSFSFKNLAKFFGIQLPLQGDPNQTTPNVRITAGQNQTGNLIEGNTFGTTGGNLLALNGATGALTTKNNTLDDGSGNTTLVGGIYGASVIRTLSAVSNLVATNAATISIATPIASLTLTSSSWTMSNPTGGYDGQKVIWRLIQDSTGSRTIAWGTAFDWGSGTAPTLSTAAGAVDYVLGIYYAANSVWHMTSQATTGF